MIQCWVDQGFDCLHVFQVCTVVYYCMVAVGAKISERHISVKLRLKYHTVGLPVGPQYVTITQLIILVRVEINSVQPQGQWFSFNYLLSFYKRQLYVGTLLWWYHTFIASLL